MSKRDQQAERRCRRCNVALTDENSRRGQGRVCRRCHSRQTTTLALARRQRNRETAKAERDRRRDLRREKSRKAAINAGTKWSTEDANLLLDGTLSHADAAKITGRSVEAVELKRARLQKLLGLPKSIRTHATNRRGQPAYRPGAGKGAK